MCELKGRGVFLVKDGEMTATELLAKLPEGDSIIEECIYQTPEVAAFHPESVNTVRIPCIACKDGLHFLTSLFRMGKGSSVVDNAGAGGVFAAVDSTTGTVTTDGVDESGGTYIKHPDTGLTIKGFTLPEWNGAIELITELMPIIPECRYIAWDFAHTVGGWAIVEANAYGGFAAVQNADGIGLRKEVERLIELV